MKKNGPGEGDTSKSIEAAMDTRPSELRVEITELRKTKAPNFLDPMNRSNSLRE